MSERISCCAEVPIERTRTLPVEEFHRRYLSGVGTPVIVTDEIGTWPARSIWTFELFKSRYGSEGVDVSVWPGDKFRKMMLLGDYIDYLDMSGGRSPGFWIDPKTKYPRADPPEPVSDPLYLSGWGAFHLHPELLEEVHLSPTFVEDWLPLLPHAFRDVLDKATRYFSAGILLGPAGATANLHDDFLHSHAYLAQIAGTKRCTLFSPEDSANVYEGAVDPHRPDLEKFPKFRQATAFECTLAPGELLFIPSRWWHHVVALEKSITVNYNFFNRVNFGPYLTDLLRDLPAIVNGFENSPNAKAALDIRWKSAGFDFPNDEKK